jgi:vancomycin resistance protein YoaR
MSSIIQDRRFRWAAAGTVAVLVISAILFVTSARSWAQGQHDAEVLLPGTVIAGVQVGDLSIADAASAVSGVLDERLSRAVTLHHGEDVWSVSLGDLGGTADVEAAMTEARDTGAALPLLDLVRVRWLGHDSGVAVGVPIRVSESQLQGFVATVADGLDADPRTAGLRWEDGEVVLEAAAKGLEVDREATTDDLRAALRGSTDELTVTAGELQPEVDTATAEAALPLVQEAVVAVLDRVVAVTHDGGRWETSARDLGATPDLDGVVSAALDAVTSDSDLGDVEVPLDLPEESVTSFVADVAGAIDVAPRDARLDTSSGWVEFVAGRDGVAVDRGGARSALEAALRGDGDTVELEVGPAKPRVSLDDYRHVLLVRQGERRVYLYRDQEIIRDWPVAVGLAGSPTPTGIFQIGAKRANPTWNNPSPTGWGSDMPAFIGPGPDNPLGLRALNWNRDGRDTLIRFHGTPNEASIGEAASRGCVRLRNDDAIEMFDLVPTGTTVVSLDVGRGAPEADVSDDADEDGEQPRRRGSGSNP